MSFSDEARSYDDTRKRTGSDYVKFTDDYRVALRILDDKAKTVWKHFIQEANGGRGMGAVCPNIGPDVRVCPIELSVADLPKDAEERRSKNARRRFVVNVLDRTPYTTCKKCGTETPGKKCISCHEDISKGHDFVPLNRIKILEHGPKLFNEVLNGVETLQKEELGLGITEYDLTFSTQGQGRDKRTNAIPQAPKKLDSAWLLDPETGEPQKRFDLDLLAEPTSVEEILLMLDGATMQELNAVRGIA